MANRYTKLFVDNAVLSKYGKSLHRLVEYPTTPGLVYTVQDTYPYNYSCDGAGDAVLTDRLVIADTINGKFVTRISDNAFGFANNITSAVLPSCITYIGAGAFEGCTSMTSINIPAGVTRIESRTFQQCAALTSIIIPDGVTAIDSHAFSNCSSLESIVIPASVLQLQDSSLAYCSSSMTIYYKGTESQWNAITKNQTWCIPNNYKVVYEYTDN
jgi:hypothetical protein